jgi:predicted nucleic acid-binding protein
VNNAYVLDSSVAIRWYLDQPGHEHAREIRDRLVEGTIQLVAPAVLRWEVANVLRKLGALTGKLTESDVTDALLDLPVLGVEIVEDDEASTIDAVTVSLERRISVFDASFALQSLQTGYPLLTADIRLARSGAGWLSTEVLRGSSRTA